MEISRRKYLIRKTSLFVIILLVSVSVIFGYNRFSKFNGKFIGKVNAVHPIIPDSPKVSTVNLIMVGDALIHDSIYKDANRLANYDGYDFKPQVEYIKEVVKNYDLAYYNQETILGGTSLGLSNYPRFNSPQEVGDAMVDAGFNLVSLATNHTLDKGKNAVLESRKYWNKHEGVQAVGSYSSMEEKKEIESRILEKNGITYAILNYTYGTNGIAVSEDYLVNLWPTYNDIKYNGYKENVKKDIESIRDKVDVLMVAMHWGVEYTHVPTNYERDMAKFLADNGVDIVIGTHPHVIQPVEWIGKTIVFYSLGNFISSQYQNQSSCTYYKCVVGLMSSLKITKTEYGGSASIKIDDVNNELIYTYYKDWRNFKVIPFSNPEIKTHLDGYQSVYNKYAKIIETSDKRIKTVPLTS